MVQSRETKVIAILMAPHTIPSRFSLLEEAEPPPPPAPQGPPLVDMLALAAARLRRPFVSWPRERQRVSSAAAW